MGKNNYILLLFLSISSLLFAKGNPEKYIVYFKDKPVNENISSLFTEKAIAKKKKFNISFDERDIPVNKSYIEQLRNQDANIISSSNWLNAVIIEITGKKIERIKNLPFVLSVIKAGRPALNTGIAAIAEDNACTELTDFEDTYTSSFPQFHLLNGEYLHEQGFNGENMTIAVCDGGFNGTNTIAAFNHLRSENRILGTYDYVNNDSTVFESIAHGTNVLSCIAGIISNQYLGTSTKSDFYLFLTENASSERLQEEFNLATALERCDQLGVDVVNISLGYTTFDVASENHDTSDMKKNITPSAKAVNIASSKGMLVCVAAGNEGNGTWKYISSPSDADSAFCIAAVDVNGNVASFSGHGLATDTRVKPNVAAVGWNTKIISATNSIVQSNGTSFAAPSLAGMAACLWQAFPTKTNWEIKTAIEQSASKYLTPDKRIGYGIPDFKKAYQLLSSTTYVSNKELENEFSVFPNPFLSSVNIVSKGNTNVERINVINNIGQTIYTINAPIEYILALQDLPGGMYVLQIETDKGLLIKKLIKE